MSLLGYVDAYEALLRYRHVKHFSWSKSGDLAGRAVEPPRPQPGFRFIGFQKCSASDGKIGRTTMCVYHTHVVLIAGSLCGVMAV